MAGLVMLATTGDLTGRQKCILGLVLFGEVIEAGLYLLTCFLHYLGLVTLVLGIRCIPYWGHTSLTVLVDVL
ncbi:MAG: hypothetical protein HY665_00315 [Chloroflexi bacterium]|nr:hypothetical protein [Chloroflexota bacterium]